MAELHPLAKRIHNASPAPVRLTLSDGTEGTFRFSSTEFFQQEFQAEGTRDGDDAEYRLLTSEDNADLLVGCRAPDEDGWHMVGRVERVERLDDATE